MQVRGRLRAVLACAALAAGGCSDASGKVQELPPLQRPTPEARAGLPEVRGIWRFAGFEIRPQDTLLVREQAYQMVPLAELRIITQRLDSVAGQIVRAGVGFPFTGEVRRDGTLALVTFSEGQGQFVSGRMLRDTFWIELTTVTESQGWSPGARAAMVRRVGGPPFRRLLGGAPITPPVDSARLRDSLRLDSLRRAGVAAPPAQPGVQPPVTTQPQPGVPAQPGARPTIPATQPQAQPQRPAQQPPAQQRPPAQQPRPRPQNPPPADTPTPPVDEPDPDPEPPARPPPNPNAPKDTIRFGQPPVGRG
ncbi:MAG TPA: hypothetical protein VFR37_18090 [Longimicrobium sp.]|nr:hypothetical protein [Longimicrobium sp.]